MSVLYAKFLRYIPKDSYILDLGCGSGRDSYYFMNQGYIVDAIDGSKKMCELVSKNSSIKVTNLHFTDLKEYNKYDAIWACASLLHVKYINLVDILAKIEMALKVNGFLYVSFKYGDFEGIRESKYYTDMTEERFEKIYSNSGLILVEQWISEDVMKEY